MERVSSIYNIEETRFTLYGTIRSLRKKNSFHNNIEERAVHILCDIVQNQVQKNMKKSEKNTCIFLRGRVYSQLL